MLHIYLHAEDDLLILFGYVVPALISYPIFLGITECSTKRVGDGLCMLSRQESNTSIFRLC